MNNDETAATSERRIYARAALASPWTSATGLTLIAVSRLFDGVVAVLIILAALALILGLGSWTLVTSIRKFGYRREQYPRGYFPRSRALATDAGWDHRPVAVANTVALVVMLVNAVFFITLSIRQLQDS